MRVGTAVAVLRRTTDRRSADGYEVLLAKRRIEQYWELPGGKVGESETILHGAVREFYEEIGVHLPTSEFVRLGECEGPGQVSPLSCSWLTVFFGIMSWIPEDIIQLSIEHDAARFFPITHMPDNIWANADYGVLLAIRKLTIDRDKSCFF